MATAYEVTSRPPNSSCSLAAAAASRYSSHKLRLGSAAALAACPLGVAATAASLAPRVVLVLDSSSSSVSSSHLGCPPKLELTVSCGLQPALPSVLAVAASDWCCSSILRFPSNKNNCYSQTRLPLDESGWKPCKCGNFLWPIGGPVQRCSSKDASGSQKGCQMASSALLTLQQLLDRKWT